MNDCSQRCEQKLSRTLLKSGRNLVIFEGAEGTGSGAEVSGVRVG